MFDGAPCERRHEMQFQSFVERYVATLFAQCRQIATVFETGDGPKVADDIPRAGIALPILDFESISLDEKDATSSMALATLGAELEPDVLPPHGPMPSAPSGPSRRPTRPAGPKKSSMPPGPWSTRESEASRLQRILDGVASPSFRRSRHGTSSRGDRPEARNSPSKDSVRRNSIRRASITSASSVMSCFRIPGRGQLSSRRQFTSADSLVKEDKSEEEGKRSKSIFALPGEEDDGSKVVKASKRRSFLSGRGRAKPGEGAGRYTSKGYSKAKRCQAQEVNKSMEAKFLERFRLAKEDDMETAVPQTSTNVLLLHQLAAMVALSFDDTRLAKAAFDNQDTQHKGYLELEDFVQAVLEIHQTINVTCTTATMVQCEHLCDSTFPADEGSTTIDLVQFLQWYSNYSFHESLLLAPDMRDLRRLSRQYGIPWEEVHNVKRHFDAVDTDGSGEIDFEEFSEVLRKVLQVAPDLELPPNRARHFWKQLDTDGSGKADFSEFLPWWLKYFHHKDGKKMLVKPFEDFYRSVRNLKNPDPPPFKNKMGKRMVFGQFEDPAKGAQRATAERRISAILTERRMSWRKNSDA